MPRRAKGPRLHLRQREGRDAVYVILDRGTETSTGCGIAQLGEAERALEDYLTRKRLTSLRNCDPSQVTIDEVLSFYTDGRGDDLVRLDMLRTIVPLLLEHAGADTVDKINGDWCRSYVAKRTSGKIKARSRPGHKKPRLPKKSSVRRDLEHLASCLNYAVKEGLLAFAPKLTYPQASKARQRFLTRTEAASLLWTCWRYKQHGPKNQVLYPLRHLCRFILIGIYSGTRSSAILSSSFSIGPGRSYVDLRSGVLHRLAEGRSETNKLQPAVGLPNRLLAHLRRWQPKSNTGWAITFHGEPVASVKKAFARAAKLAGLESVTPHVLRHTFMTWVLTDGMEIHTAAKIAGMSVKMADRVYGHLDTSRREGLNEAFRAKKRGHNMGGTRTSAAKSA